MTEDGTLLRRYAEESAESAFAELVQRHVHLVYFSALRPLGGDAHLARDVTQLVFVELARRAEQLAQHRSLAGWLYLTARNQAAKLVRSEVRRRAREAEADAITMTSNEPDGQLDWDRVAPVLDQALCQLSPRDREAVLLRLWENRAVGDIARIHDTTEGAVRMRLARSLERLRAGLKRAGIPSTAAAIEQALQTQAMAACPPALSAHVASAAMKTAAAHGAASGWAIFMSATSTKVIGTAAVAAVLLALGTSEARTTRRLEASLHDEERKVEALHQLVVQRTADESAKSVSATIAPTRAARPVSRTGVGANPTLGQIPSGTSRATMQVTSYGAPSWEGQPVTLEKFLANLVEYRKAHPEDNAQLLIAANGTVSTQLAYLFDQAARAGLRNVWFDPSSHSPLSGPPLPGSEAPAPAAIHRTLTKAQDDAERLSRNAKP